MTKDLCNAAISSAVYEIAKENIDTMLSSTKEEVHDSDIPIAVKTTEDENNQQTRDNALVCIIIFATKISLPCGIIWRWQFSSK